MTWSCGNRQLKAIYTAPSLDAAEVAFGEFAEQWEAKYPAMVKSWRDTWDTGRINSWKSILNTLTIHYGDLLAAVNN